jgi:hypothetical protein
MNARFFLHLLKSGSLRGPLMLQVIFSIVMVKELRKLRNVFVLNLGLSDLLVNAISMPFNIFGESVSSRTRARLECGTVPVPPFALQMDSSTQLTTDMFLFRIK